MTEVTAGGAQHVPAEPWSGRTDGPERVHRRWHDAVNGSDPGATRVSLVGFACDEGVRRNLGRPGAADGPRALRGALASLALHSPIDVHDLGDVVVTGHALEDGQDLLGTLVAEALPKGLTLVFGGGNGAAYGTFLGLERAGLLSAERTLGILNFDAHFDLREDQRATSGTPFRQIATAQKAAGRQFRYAVCGASWHNNTEKLFRTAWSLGTETLMDEECTEPAVVEFVKNFAASVDDLYLTIDLDVLPGYVAPGVSAPSSLGVDLRAVIAGVRAAAASGKLIVAEVVELNPAFDIDDRTARAAARIVGEIVSTAVERA